MFNLLRNIRFDCKSQGNTFDFQCLLNGPSLEKWSVAELVHAIVIMVHFHALAGFVYGCGVNPEIDLEGGHTFITPSISDSSSNAEPTTPTSNALNCFTDLQKLENNTQTLLERMKQVEKEHEEEEEASQEEVLRQFQIVEKGECRFFALLP